jgi:hypothetical protein
MRRQIMDEAATEGFLSQELLQHADDRRAFTITNGIE